MTNYDDKFRARMIASLMQRSFLAKFGIDFIKPSYFESEEEVLVVRHLLAYMRRYGHPPASLDAFLAYTKSDAGRISQMSAMIFDIHAHGFDDEQFTTETVLNFVRTAAIKQALILSIDDLMDGELDSPAARISDATKVGIDTSDIGYDLVEDAESWMADIKDPKVPTGWMHIDRILHGGLARKELGVILAPPNQGKTMSLINIGTGAAGPIGAAHVVHFSLEMAKQSVLRRYAARTVFRFQDVYEDDEEYMDALERASKIRLAGKIRVLSYPTDQLSVQDMIVKIEQMVDQDVIDPDRLCIIDDYADLHRYVGRATDTRHELIDIYKQLRGMASHFNCPVWTASQAGRQALSKPVVTIEDFAEAFGKAAVADVVISKCETPEEADNGEGRLFMAKIRDEAGAGKSITYKYHEESMAMTTTGIARYRDNRREDEDVADSPTLRRAIRGRRIAKRSLRKR